MTSSALFSTEETSYHMNWNAETTPLEAATARACNEPMDPGGIMLQVNDTHVSACKLETQDGGLLIKHTKRSSFRWVTLLVPLNPDLLIERNFVSYRLAGSVSQRSAFPSVIRTHDDTGAFHDHALRSVVMEAGDDSSFAEIGALDFRSILAEAGHVRPLLLFFLPNVTQSLVLNEITVI